MTHRPLSKKAGREVLALLRRKVDAHPLLPLLESTMAQIFAELTARTARAAIAQ
ncbi:hypothetical protein [Aquabacterium sp.]|uniref:hypothetical protein n=1 Tax=Aquabacterium sp. TaxID=1872578 RepID=UPI002D809F38|nr:hypothetical protein [Aquabacterium sp.]